MAEAHQRMVDGALAEAVGHAAVRAEIVRTESLSGGAPWE